MTAPMNSSVGALLLSFFVCTSLAWGGDTVASTAAAQAVAAAEQVKVQPMQEAAADFPASLLTETPQEGFALAIKLSRLGVKATQPDIEVLKELRPIYSTNADSLIAASGVVALHFQTIAAANDHWRPREGEQ